MNKAPLIVLAFCLLISISACSLFFSDFKGTNNDIKGNVVIHLSSQNSRSFEKPSSIPSFGSVIFTLHKGAESFDITRYNKNADNSYSIEVPAGEYDYISFAAKTSPGYLLGEVVGKSTNSAPLNIKESGQGASSSIYIEIEPSGENRRLAVPYWDSFSNWLFYAIEGLEKETEGQGLPLGGTFPPYTTADQYGRFYVIDDGCIAHCENFGQPIAYVNVSGIDSPGFNQEGLFFFYDETLGDKLFITYKSVGGGYNKIGWVSWDEVEEEYALTPLEVSGANTDHWDITRIVADKVGNDTYVYVVDAGNTNITYKGNYYSHLPVLRRLKLEGSTLNDAGSKHFFDFLDSEINFLEDPAPGSFPLGNDYLCHITDITVINNKIYALLAYQIYMEDDDTPCYPYTGVLLEIDPEAFVNGPSGKVKYSYHYEPGMYGNYKSKVLDENTESRRNEEFLNGYSEYFGSRFLGSNFDDDKNYLYILDTGGFYSSGFIDASNCFNRVMGIPLPFGPNDKFEGPGFYQSGVGFEG